MNTHVVPPPMNEVGFIHECCGDLMNATLTSSNNGQVGMEEARITVSDVYVQRVSQLPPRRTKLEDKTKKRRVLERPIQITTTPTSSGDNPVDGYDMLAQYMASKRRKVVTRAKWKASLQSLNRIGSSILSFASSFQLLETIILPQFSFTK